jgi:hypothetical protein
MSDEPRIPWSAIAPSLSDYDRDGLHAALTALLDGALPARGPLSREWSQRRPVLEATQRLIAAHTGAWYPGGRVPIYSEQLGSACSCHSFCAVGVGEGHTRAEAVAACVAGVLAELSRVREYLLALADLYADLSLPDEPAARLVALEEAAETLVDLIILHTETNDCWYPLIIDAGIWLAEVIGATPPDLEARLDRTVHAWCTSWSAPDRAQRKGLHGDLAEILG